MSTLQQRLSSILVAAAGCQAVYPTLEERKKHFMQWHEPTVEELLTESCVADCYRIALALLLVNKGNCKGLCPGHLSGLISFLFNVEQRDTMDTMQRGDVVYLENTLLTQMSKNINHFHSGAIGWWVIAFGKGADLKHEDIEYYKKQTNEPIDDNAYYILAFVGRCIQLLTLEALIKEMFVRGERDLENSNISLQKKQADIKVKVRGHVCSFQTENIQNYVRQLTHKYNTTVVEIKGDIKNLTTAKLDLIRMFTEGKNTYRKLLTLRQAQKVAQTKQCTTSDQVRHVHTPTTLPGVPVVPLAQQREKRHRARHNGRVSKHGAALVDR